MVCLLAFVPYVMFSYIQEEKSDQSIHCLPFGGNSLGSSVVCALVLDVPVGSLRQVRKSLVSKHASLPDIDISTVHRPSVWDII